MIIQDLKAEEIINNPKINSKFLSVSNNDLQLSCRVLNCDFFLDSFNYFPITSENYSFKEIYSWGDSYKYNNFFSENFRNNFEKQKNNIKNLSNTYVFGSSVTDDYYRNMITFLPRIFFIDNKKINLALHRDSSNKYRNFIIQILDHLKVKVGKFVYLDDGFYYFANSKIPQFFSETLSVQILNKALSKKNLKERKKVYVSRQSSNFRNLINEGDFTSKLKKEDFIIIDTKNMPIIEQIEIFSSAKIIIGPTGSALTNIIFCQKGTKVIEISPKYKFEYEKTLKSRYSNICVQLGLDYTNIEADPIEADKIDPNIRKFIPSKILENSNYYKNLLVEKYKLEELISKS